MTYNSWIPLLQMKTGKNKHYGPILRKLSLNPRVLIFVILFLSTIFITPTNFHSPQKFNLDVAQGHMNSMRLKLTHIGLLVELANHYTTSGAYNLTVSCMATEIKKINKIRDFHEIKTVDQSMLTTELFFLPQNNSDFKNNYELSHAIQYNESFHQQNGLLNTHFSYKFYSGIYIHTSPCLPPWVGCDTR